MSWQCAGGDRASLDERRVFERSGEEEEVVRSSAEMSVRSMRPSPLATFGADDEVDVRRHDQGDGAVQAQGSGTASGSVLGERLRLYVGWRGT